MNATTTAAASEITDFKKSYEDAITLSMHSPVAKSIAEKVLEGFDAIAIPQAVQALHKEMEDAFKVKNFKQVSVLSKKLDEIEANEAKNNNVIKEMRKQDFSTVLKAWKPEIDSLIYEAAYKVLTSSHVAIENASKAAKGGRGTKTTTTTTSDDSTKRQQTVYQITKGDKSVTFPIRIGRAAANLKQDEVAFNLLGFKVEKEEGKEVLNPGTITQADGTEVVANRKSIVAAITAQLKGFEGVKIDDVSETH